MNSSGSCCETAAKTQGSAATAAMSQPPTAGVGARVHTMYGILQRQAAAVL